MCYLIEVLSVNQVNVIDHLIGYLLEIDSLLSFH